MFGNRLAAAIALICCYSAICTHSAAAENLKCDKFDEYAHRHFEKTYGNMEKCCVVTETSGIRHDDSTFLVVDDVTVDGLKIDTKLEADVYFLPVRIYQSYPNLIGIYSEKQKIEEISKKNFERLLKLEYLFLNDNKIRKIKSDTFEGLIKLKVVNLGELFDKAENSQVLLSNL